MNPIRLDSVLLRQHLPELVLRPGALLAVRVIERTADRGLISLAGVTLAAQLPEDVLAGETLRLRVEEAGAERVLLKVVDPATQPQPPAAATIPLPDGRTARVSVEERPARDADDGRPPTVGLAYESPELGRLDLRLELAPGAIGVTVGAALGEPAERAEAAASELSAAVARAAGRPAQVRIVPRRDPFEAYA